MSNWDNVEGFKYEVKLSENDSGRLRQQAKMMIDEADSLIMGKAAGSDEIVIHLRRMR